MSIDTRWPPDTTFPANANWIDAASATIKAFDDLCTKYLELRDDEADAWEAARTERDKRSQLEDEVYGLQAEVRELRRWPPKWLRDFDDLKAERDALREKLDDCRLQRDRYLNERDALDVKMNAFREENSRLAAQLQPLHDYAPDISIHDLIQCYEEAGHRNAEWLDAHIENKRLKRDYDAAAGERAEFEHEAEYRRKKYETLVAAVKALYFAAYWSADRQVDEWALWTALRDAAGIEPGQCRASLGPPRHGELHQKCDETITNLGRERDASREVIKKLTAQIERDCVSRCQYDELSAKYDELVAYHNTARAEDAAKLGAFDRIVDLVSPYVEEA